MKTKRPARSRGRRRFKTKLAQADDTSVPVGAKPQGQWIVESRKPLFKYLPDSTQWPVTFAEIANFYLHSQRQFPRGLSKQLRWYEQLNIKSGNFNAAPLPAELLRQAMTSNPSFAMEHFRVVRRELARLYSVAWHGRGTDSVEAKQLLEHLLPASQAQGRTPDPVTKHLPAIAIAFDRHRPSIRASATKMLADFPREIERVRKLAELYGENTGTISAALSLLSSRSFVAQQLHEVLGIPLETARKVAAAYILASR